MLINHSNMFRPLSWSHHQGVRYPWELQKHCIDLLECCYVYVFASRRDRSGHVHVPVPRLRLTHWSRQRQRLWWGAAQSRDAQIWLPRISYFLRSTIGGWKKKQPSYVIIQTFRIVPSAPDTTMVAIFMLFLLKLMEYELGALSNIMTFPDVSRKPDQLLLFRNLKIYAVTVTYNNCILPLKMTLANYNKVSGSYLKMTLTKSLFISTST